MAFPGSNSENEATSETAPDKRQGPFLDIFGKAVVPDPDGAVVRREICRSGFAMDRRAYDDSLLETAISATRRLMTEDQFQPIFRPDHPADSPYSAQDPMPSFGRVANVELESFEKGLRVMATINLNELGKNMTEKALFPGVSIGLMPLPSLASGKILAIGMNHVAATGASIAAYAALQRSLPNTDIQETPVDQSDQTLFDKFKALFSSKGNEMETETKNRSMSPEQRSAGLEAIKALAALFEEPKEDEEEEEKPEEASSEDREIKAEGAEERQQDPTNAEVRSTEEAPEMKEMRSLLAENRSLAVDAQFRSLVESGKAAPDGREAFLADVKKYDLERAIDLANRSHVAFPPQSGFRSGTQFSRDDAKLNREMDEAGSVLGWDTSDLKVSIEAEDK